jgi:hypothetical protein
MQAGLVGVVKALPFNTKHKNNKTGLFFIEGPFFLTKIIVDL